MPLYEYACDKCGEKFEVMQKFADEPLTTHEKCGGSVQRLISAPALQFKGSGFYITDYAKSSTSSPSDNGGSSSKSEKSEKSGDKSASGSDTSTSSTPSSSSSSSSSDSKPSSSESK